MATPGLVSVIVPVLNAERFLGAALDSVAAQTHTSYEILVVDGGSTDGTEAIARRNPRARWLPQAGAGLASAWNTGLAQAVGEFIAFLDADDLWVPHKLEVQVRCLTENPAALYVLALVQHFLEAGAPPPPGMLPEAFDRPYLGRMPGTLLARRPVFDRVGLFDPGYGVTSDVAWFAALDALGLTHHALPEVLLHKRIHSGNYSVQSGLRAYAPHLPRLLKQALDLRRARPPVESSHDERSQPRR